MMQNALALKHVLLAILPNLPCNLAAPGPAGADYALRPKQTARWWIVPTCSRYLEALAQINPLYSREATKGALRSHDFPLRPADCAVWVMMMDWPAVVCAHLFRRQQLAHTHAAVSLLRTVARNHARPHHRAAADVSTLLQSRSWSPAMGTDNPQRFVTHQPPLHRLYTGPADTGPLQQSLSLSHAPLLQHSGFSHAHHQLPPAVAGRTVVATGAAGTAGGQMFTPPPPTPLHQPGFASLAHQHNSTGWPG
jgi:hypothetical protein